MSSAQRRTQEHVPAPWPELAQVPPAEAEHRGADQRRKQAAAPAQLVAAGHLSRGAQRLEDQEVRLGDLLAVSDDLLALADLKEDVLDLRALPFLPPARLGVVVREVRLQGAPDELRDGAGGARRQVGELDGDDG